jgi:DNA-binding response OmpR family regulator
MGTSMIAVDENHTDQHGLLHGARIIVVEDEAIVALLLADSLRDAGADVIGPAGSVARALTLIDEASLNGGLSAAVLDVNLGGHIVWPVADKLIALGVPFLFATGYGWGLDRSAYPKAPIVAKPFDIGALISTVASITNAPQETPEV